MAKLIRLLAAALLFAAALFPVSGFAQENTPSAQIAWRLLDYIAVDYPGAVADGRVISAAEYAEMKEFSGTVRERLTALPATPAQGALLAKADALIAHIDRRAAPQEVAARARSLASDLLAAYPTPLAPNAAPDLARGAALYAEQCASCHGATGHADGVGARGLDPPPVAFADADRASQRSIFGLYQVISQGLEGTAMASFSHLPPEDRWALAFHAGGFAFDENAARDGESLWRRGGAARASVPNMQTLVQKTPADLAAEIGQPAATQIVAYLRRHPEAVLEQGDTLAIAREKLSQSVARYEAGDRRGAQELALAAYLDGFEPVEPILSARDSALLTRVEGAMGALRASINAGAPSADVRAQAERLSALFDAAERVLAPQEASAASSFAGAFAILLREGLEALLIVVAMIAFLGKADRRDVLPYVHGGWIAALAAGVLTWAAATTLISISGASRELTEGFGSLLAAIVLISVGIWMHGKAQSDAWQAYIRDKLSHALSKRSAWFLFLLAFLVVYREVFETILFYVALWAQGAHLAILAGAATAVVVLAVIAWALLSYSKKLPIGQFFSYSASLIAVLAVVLAAKGVAGLQEAGLVDIHPLAMIPRIDVLGLYPTWETFIAQVLTLAAIIIGFTMNRRRSPPQAA
jgi:high-affinity iron transporter